MCINIDINRFQKHQLCRKRQNQILSGMQGSDRL